MIRRRSLRTRAIKMLVLDEADEMLNKGRVLISQWREMAFLKSMEFYGVSAAI